MAVFVLLGLFLGMFLASAIASFLCVVGERVPRKESINGRSHCVCGRELSWYENVPIFGWMVSGGKSRCCKTKIPTRYVKAETAAGVVGGVCGALLTYAAGTGTLDAILAAGCLLALVAVEAWVLKTAWVSPEEDQRSKQDTTGPAGAV